MPPKTRVTEDMIVGAALDVVRESGFENINARTVSERLRCSTQPVMYHFATIEELKRAVYTQVDRLHTGYLMSFIGERDPLLNWVAHGVIIVWMVACCLYLRRVETPAIDRLDGQRT